MHATMPSPTRACSACGGLECLCRPRFRAGQVLTETDLNCLEQYVVRKQQRHNRYLHGTGVVCGMQVRCHPCPGWVTVTSGFAIGPCGEEIALPGDHPLNVCQMIRDCRTAGWKNWACEPYAGPCGPGGRSAEVEESWFVTVRYDEAETRGRTADCDPCGQPAGCGCGKKGTTTGKCGCGGNGPATTAKPAARPATRPPVECEPNRICEGYRLEIAPAPPPKKPKPEDLLHGTFFGAVMECVKEAVAVFRVFPNLTLGLLRFQNAAEVVAKHAAFRAAVIKFLADHPGGKCSTSPTLPDVPRGPTADEQNKPSDYITNAGVDTANDALRELVIAAIKNCVCGSFFPPCPEDAADPRLVLAVVTTKGPDCKIVDICEARCRKQLVTIPAIEYWVSVLPALWALLERFCCDAPKPAVMGARAAAATTGDGSSQSRTPFNTLLTHISEGKAVSPEELLLGSLSLIATTLSESLGGRDAPRGGDQ